MPSNTTSPILSSLNEIYELCKGINEGNVASYIPELAKVDPELFGICLATADGKIYEIGQSQYPFTIQSISKPFVYGLALADNGQQVVSQKVGVEPTGEAFNSIIFDEVNNRPYNPMVNAGAIATTALIKGKGYEERFSRILKLFEDFVGHPLEVDEAVFISEKTTGHRNRAIAYLELNAGMIDEPIAEHLDLYFRQCSILITAKDLSVMAATLANNGINPLTQKKAIDSAQVTSILSVMTSCGMYDFSGEWLYRIGLPAKSGVGGGIIAVLPGQFGIGIFSPPLDERGNSVRGIRVCKEFSSWFKLHLFDPHAISAESIISRTYTGAVISSKRQRRRVERAILERSNAQITVYELQGDLYFATVERLIRRLQESQASTQYLILDGHRLGRVDSSALSLLKAIPQWLATREMMVKMAGFAAPICETLKDDGWPEDAFFVDVDAALEWCENRLLAAANLEYKKYVLQLSLAEMDIFQHFSEGELQAIAPLLKAVFYQPNAFIICEGEDADCLFLLAAGTATVSLQLPGSQQRKRLTTYIPGVTFGELCLFEVGKRTADVIADMEVICYVLPLVRLEELLVTAPEVYVKLLSTFGKILVDTLRRATAEVRSLSAS